MSFPLRSMTNDHPSSVLAPFLHNFMKHVLALVVSLLVVPALASAQAPAAARTLTVVSASPSGEVASLAEANEIRIVFSEPMVTLGKIPAVVRAPFVRITPAIAGAFRWSGTTVLIFTPDAKPPLPYATRYDVTVEPTATAISGRTLGAAHSFSFTTPTVKLLSTDGYRRGGRADAPFVVMMRFNQPVDPAAVLEQMNARFEPYTWAPPTFPANVQQRLAAADPTSLARFNAKVAATRAAASSKAPVTLRLTQDWDRKRFPPSRDLVAFETVTTVPSQSRVRLTLGAGLRSPAGPATPGRAQSYALSAEPAFFVRGLECTTACDPDLRNRGRARGRCQGHRLCQGAADQERDRRRRHRRRPSGAGARSQRVSRRPGGVPDHRGWRLRGAAAGDDLRR